MELPRILPALRPRSIEDISAIAKAVQANVVALRVAWCKRTGQPPDAHDIQTPPPGTVSRMRDILIDRQTLKSYSEEEIMLRLRQVWGEFCALCWLFPHVEPQKPIPFDPLPDGQGLRCLGQVQEKLAEIQTGLWRLRHEQRRRFDPDARKDPEFQREIGLAASRPMQVFGQNISTCGDSEIFCCACEYAGMLAALRWATDDRWSWEAPGIMELTLSTS